MRCNFKNDRGEVRKNIRHWHVLIYSKGLRRGISYIAKRHAIANNKYTGDYDAWNLSTFITYLDINNLYGWAMSEYLSYGRFEWLKNIDEFDVMSVSEKSEIG